MGIIVVMQPAIFLDRDGVIIDNRADYVRSWDDVEIFSQALEAIAALQGSPYKIIIVTNQSPIGRGILTYQQVDQINQRLLKVIGAAGGTVDGLYLCPHKPEDGCNCRKPQPGMLLRAAREHKIDLEGSIMIGDAFTDLQAGLAAGVKRVALVRTGRGADQEKSVNAAGMPPFATYDTLSQAIFDLVLN